MKSAIHIIILVIISHMALAQSTTFDTIHLVSNEHYQASGVYAVDIDGDNDFDIIACSMEGPGIAWHENIDGEMSETLNIISNIVTESVYQIMAVDMDGDDDPDILASSPSFAGYNIFWYENIGGGNFSSEKLIEANAPGTLGIFAADFNGDSIADVLAANETEGKLGWYANDGSGNFSAFQMFSDTAFGATSVSAADIDKDDDYDAVAGYGNRVAWFRNDGDGVFYEERVLTWENEAIDVRKVTVGDMDNDDDMDILSASFIDNKIAWYENMGYLNFNQDPRVISLLAVGAVDLHVQDFDGDNDLDIVSASNMDNRIIWYQNVINMDLEDDFNRYVLTFAASGATGVYSADIDIDGDNDIITSSANNNAIKWMQNDFDYVFNWYYEFCEGDTVLVINGEEIIATDTISDTLVSVHGRDSINVHYVLFNPTPEHFIIEGPTYVTAGDTTIYRVNTTPNVQFMWDIENGTQVSYGASDTVAIHWQSSETGMGKVISLGYYPVTFCYTTEELDVIIEPAGINEHSLFDVYVYPNPAKGMFYINNFKQGYISQVYNFSGDQVLLSKKEEIDVSGLQPGLYFVQVLDKKSEPIMVSKVVVQ